jgi:hypothetical protein
LLLRNPGIVDDLDFLLGIVVDEDEEDDAIFVDCFGDEDGLFGFIFLFVATVAVFGSAIIFFGCCVSLNLIPC